MTLINEFNFSSARISKHAPVLWVVSDQTTPFKAVIISSILVPFHSPSRSVFSSKYLKSFYLVYKIRFLSIFLVNSLSLRVSSNQNPLVLTV